MSKTFICASCGQLVQLDQLHNSNDNDDEGYCNACYGHYSIEGDPSGYSYRPKPIFYGEGPRYLMVALEIGNSREVDRKAAQIQAIGNELQERICIKRDGNLGNGLEIVTHPMTLEYHRNEMPWQEIIQKTFTPGESNHESQTCALHVHVNRSSLGGFREEQEETIARLLFLVENFWNELLRFGHRTQGQIAHWISHHSKKDVLCDAKCKSNCYTYVNLTPRYTIGFRIFRGMLNYNTLIAALQMVDLLCDAALSLSDEQAKDLTWNTFVSLIQEDTTPELIQYLKECQLYTYELIEVAEEV